MISSTIDLVEKELVVFGCDKDSIPTLILGVLFLTWGFAITAGYKFKAKCSKITCSELESTINKINELNGKLDKLSSEIKDDSRDEHRELRSLINRAHNDLSQLTGQLSVNRVRKVIKHEDY